MCMFMLLHHMNHCLASHNVLLSASAKGTAVASREHLLCAWCSSNGYGRYLSGEAGASGMDEDSSDSEGNDIVNRAVATARQQPTAQPQYHSGAWCLLPCLHSNSWPMQSCM